MEEGQLAGSAVREGNVAPAKRVTSRRQRGAQETVDLPCFIPSHLLPVLLICKPNRKPRAREPRVMIHRESHLEAAGQERGGNAEGRVKLKANWHTLTGLSHHFLPRFIGFRCPSLSFLETSLLESPDLSPSRLSLQDLP